VGQSETSAELETYDGPLINQKLGAYPELADAIGMAHVSTCDDARAFMLAYNSYRSIHPGFDEDTLSKEEMLREWDAEGLIDTDPEVQQLAGVQYSADFSIVKIQRYYTAAEVQLDPSLQSHVTFCTAVRLTPLVYLTAAHCLPNVTTEKVKSFNLSIKRINSSGTNGVYYYGGTNIPVGKRFLAYGRVLGAYVGSGDAANDIAVFRIEEPTDQPLNDVGEGVTAKLSSRTPKVGDVVKAVGWGKGSNDEQVEVALLRISDAVSIQRQVTDLVTIPYVNSVMIPHIQICSGDSGGPLRLDANRHVIGVLSSSGFNPPLPVEPCTSPDQDQYWARVDKHIQEIRTIVAGLQVGKAPKYGCKFRPAVPGMLDPENVEAYYDCAKLVPAP